MDRLYVDRTFGGQDWFGLRQQVLKVRASRCRRFCFLFLVVGHDRSVTIIPGGRGYLLRPRDCVRGWVGGDVFLCCVCAHVRACIVFHLRVFWAPVYMYRLYAGKAAGLVTQEEGKLVTKEFCWFFSAEI